MSLTTFALPVLALLSGVQSAPLAPRAGCPGAVDSFSFDVKQFTYNDGTTFSTPAHQIPGGFVNFNLTSAYSPVPRQCDASSTQLSDFYYNTVNYTCTFSTGGGTTSQSSSNFTYDTPSETLRLYETFVCDNQNYIASATYKFDPELECTTTEYKNPDWQEGEIYSSTSRKCQPRDVVIPAKVDKVDA